MQGRLVVAGGRWSRCQGDREHLGSPPLPTETQEKRVPSAQPPALLLVGKFPAGGEGKEVGSSPEPYKPQQLRRVVRVVRPCLAFLPAAAGTSPPAPLEGRVPLVPLGSREHASCLTLCPVPLSGSRCGPPTPSPGLSLPCVWPPVLPTVGSTQKAQQGRPRGAAGEDCPPTPTPARPGDHTPPTLPFPPPAPRSPLLITSQQGTAAGL